ncbi:hypothetical protein ABIA39_002826 [Nocardia sp. GAS34]|uniref:Rv0361 family membrane protein n=1 Tax=unclassified Nocardia TaxID=2637762 RepID=UPI003D1F4EEC
MSDPTDDQKPQPDSADSGRRPSASAPGSGPASAPTSPDASATQRISRDQLPGAGGAAGVTERIPRAAGAAGPDTSAAASAASPTPVNAPSTPRPGVGPSPLPPRPAPKPPAPPVPPRPGATVPPTAAGPGAEAETQAIAKGAAGQPASTGPDQGAGDKTTVIPTSVLPQSGGMPSGTAGSDSAAATPDRTAAGGKTAVPPRPTMPATGGKSSAATESAPGGDTVIIPESALPGTGGELVDDPKTVAMPQVSGASDAETTALPVQRPGEQATEKLQIGGQPSTDRVTPPGGRAPITRPPATPRPGSGPKNTVPQGPSSPMQSPPAGGGVPGPRPGGAPSPADVRPTAPAPSMSSPTAPMSARQDTPHDAPQTAAPPSPDAQQTRVIAAPQRIPGANPPMDAPAGGTPQRNKRRLLIAGAVAAAVVVIAVIIALVSGGTNNSPEAKVKAAIGDYTTALKSGNLPDLQSATCGAQHDFYRSIAPDQYASVHKLAVDQRKIPKVDAVDSVQITGDKAVAQASVYTDADPTRVARTFDLQNTATGWKVCDSPNAG